MDANKNNVITFNTITDRLIDLKADAVSLKDMSINIRHKLYVDSRESESELKEVAGPLNPQPQTIPEDQNRMLHLIYDDMTKIRRNLEFINETIG